MHIYRIFRVKLRHHVRKITSKAFRFGFSLRTSGHGKVHLAARSLPRRGRLRPAGHRRSAPLGRAAAAALPRTVDAFSRRLGGHRRSAEGAGAARRSASPHRDAAAALRVVRVQRPQASARWRESAGRTGRHLGDDAAGVGRVGVRSRHHQVPALRIPADGRERGRSAPVPAQLRGDLSGAGSPRGSVDAQHRRVRPLLGGGRAPQRTDHQRFRHRQSRGRSSRDRAPALRHLGGHAAWLLAAGMEAQVRDQASGAQQVPLLRRRRRAGAQRAPALPAYERGAGRAGGDVCAERTARLLGVFALGLPIALLAHPRRG